MPSPLPHPSASAMVSGGVTHADRPCHMVGRLVGVELSGHQMGRDLGGTSWDRGMMAAGEDLGRDLP